MLEDHKRAKATPSSDEFPEPIDTEPYEEQVSTYIPAATCKFFIYLLLLLLRKARNEITNLIMNNANLEDQRQRKEKVCDTLRKENETLKKENGKLNLENQRLSGRMKKEQSLTSKLLVNDKSVNFYTGIECRKIFDTLHDYLCKFVKRRWRGFSFTCSNIKRRNFHKSPKKFGVERKLCSEDEFLMTLMWIRLGLLKQDLAGRFNISPTLCSQILNSWISVMATASKHLVKWATQEDVLITKPARYRQLPDLCSIIDCTEIFIERPANHRLQRATWSEYKHHNTGKILISVAPNSHITFISKMYNGRASDKAITLASGFLDKFEPYCMIQADKGFNIGDECAARNLYLHVPPGKRGQAQMSIAANNKTTRIANLRILVEQVIARLKTFRIIKYTVPIGLVPVLDKVVLVCAALTNLKAPIYSD